MIVIRLEWYEILEAAHVGLVRKVECIRSGRKDAHGLKGAVHDWTMDISGAIAEKAAAKALSMYWPGGINTFKAPDLGGYIQVRLCQNPYDPHIIVRPGDDNNQIYVLVTADPHDPCVYRLHGWIVGEEAKQPQYAIEGDRPKAYRVPAKHLRDFSLFPHECGTPYNGCSARWVGIDIPEQKGA